MSLTPTSISTADREQAGEEPRPPRAAADERVARGADTRADRRSDAGTEARSPVLRLLPVPVAEPFVAEPVPPRRPQARAAWSELDVPAFHGTLALRLAVPEDAEEEEPVSVTPLPEPRAWANQFVLAAVEVEAGSRPAGQLLRWTTPEVHATLARRGAASVRAAREGAGRRRAPAAVRALHTHVPRPGVCEVSAVVTDHQRGRVRALALRMEGLRGRWRVTALELG